MIVRCSNCGQLNSVPDGPKSVAYYCYNCGAFLPRVTAPSSDTSAAVGLIGGAALGAAIGGPVGAIIGAVIGTIIGREAKGGA